MKPRSRERHKGRQDSGSFTRIPHAIQEAPNWRLLSHVAVHLLLDLARQYRGRNNGDLCAALSVLRPFGWKSNDTVGTALRELQHYGFIVLTRQGGLHAPSLYALTWRPIDECAGKLEVASTAVAGGEWKQTRAKFKRPPRKTNHQPAGRCTAAPPAGALADNAAPPAGAKSASAVRFAAPPTGDLSRYLPSGSAANERTPPRAHALDRREGRGRVERKAEQGRAS